MPIFGQSNDLLVAHVAETTMGVTPANPAMAQLRLSGEQLNPNVTYEESDTINPNSSLSDLILTGSEAGGSIPFAVAKSAAFDDMLEAVLRGSWTGNVINGGTGKKSFTLEKRLNAGGSNKYMKFPGSRYMGMTLEGSVGGRITGSVDVMSLSGIPAATSVVGTGSVTAPVEARELSMVDVTAFTITGDTTPLIMTNFNLNVNNNGRRANGHGQVASYDITYGMREVVFSFDAYLESWEQMDKLLNRTNSNLTMTLSDGTNSYTIRLPKLRYRNVTANAGGNNQDLMQSIEGRALFDPTVGVATDIRITRV